MTLWKRFESLFSPRDEIDRVVDRVLERLFGYVETWQRENDVRLELSVKDGKIVLDPVVVQKVKNA